jgi:poly-gamma-glutamate synthesis protein (capsule biosynthesis protein)
MVSLRLKGPRVTGLDLTPYRITPRGLRALDPSEEKAFRVEIARVSKPFRSASGPWRAWQAYLAHYGTAGFLSEVTGILERMKSEPERAAAMFRNRITTMQHAELWKDTLNRVIAGGHPPLPREALETVRKWFSASADGSAGIPNR